MDDKFWLKFWAMFLPAALGAIVTICVTSQAESAKTTALCKTAIEQKADFAIAKLCR